MASNVIKHHFERYRTFSNVRNGYFQLEFEKSAALNPWTCNSLQFDRQHHETESELTILIFFNDQTQDKSYGIRVGDLV